MENDSIYEKQRLANIKANQAKLATLGFAQSSLTAQKNKGPGVSKQASKHGEEGPTRRTIKDIEWNPFFDLLLLACLLLRSSSTSSRHNTTSLKPAYKTRTQVFASLDQTAFRCLAGGLVFESILAHRASSPA